MRYHVVRTLDQAIINTIELDEEADARHEDEADKLHQQLKGEVSERTEYPEETMARLAVQDEERRAFIEAHRRRHKWAPPEGCILVPVKD